MAPEDGGQPLGAAEPCAGGETTGFGFTGSATNGPFALLARNGYTSYAVLQCATRPGWSIAAPRRGFMPFYPNWSDKRYDPGLWFDYNGPTAAGGYLINYNHNNQLDQLGGHYTNWQAPPTPSTPGAYLEIGRAHV